MPLEISKMYKYDLDLIIEFNNYLVLIKFKISFAVGL